MDYIVTKTKELTYIETKTNYIVERLGITITIETTKQ